MCIWYSRFATQMYGRQHCHQDDNYSNEKYIGRLVDTDHPVASIAGSFRYLPRLSVFKAVSSYPAVQVVTNCFDLTGELRIAAYFVK